MSVLDTSAQTGPGDRAVAALADRAWQYRLSHDAYIRQRVGLPITSLRARGPLEAEEDAAFARALLSDIDRVEIASLNADARLTAAVLRGICIPLIAGPADLPYTCAVTPYHQSGL